MKTVHRLRSVLVAAFRGISRIAAGTPAATRDNVGPCESSPALELARLSTILADSSVASERLQILQGELAQAHDDDRAALNSLAALLAAQAAVYGVAFYLLNIDRAAGGNLSDLMWIAVPAIPFGIAGWIFNVQVLWILRGEYQLQIERTIWSEWPVWTKDESANIRVPSAAHLVYPHLDFGRNGLRVNKLMYFNYMAAQVALLLGVTVAALAQVESLAWLLAGIAIYAWQAIFGIIMQWRIVSRDHLWRISKSFHDRQHPG